MHLFLPTVILALSVLLPFAASAQRSAAVGVRPGSPLLHAARIAARTDTFELRLKSGRVAELVIHTAAPDDTTLLRVNRISHRGGMLDQDSSVVRRPTLAPLYVERIYPSGSSFVTFVGGRVEGTFTHRIVSRRTISEELSSPVFYLGSLDMVLAALPLHPGRSFDLAMWAPNAVDEGANTHQVNARVVNRETVSTVDQGRCSAWRVETRGGAGATAVYWLEERTHALLAFSTGGMEFRIIRHPRCAPARRAGRR